MCYSIKEDLYLLIKRKLVDWKAYCQSCDGSAYVYVKDKNDTDTIREVQLLLEELLQNKQNGIEFILHDEVAKDCGADGNCLFMLEAREGYYFTENYTGDFIKEITEKDVTPSKNIHLVRMDTLQQNLTMKQFLSPLGKE